MFINVAVEERTSPKNKDGKSETYSVAKTAYVICLTCGRCWTDVDVSGKALVPRLVTAESEVIVGVLEEGEKSGQFDNAPILLAEPSDVLVGAARVILNDYAHKMPSGRILFDDTAFNGPADGVKPF
jgi:hypothetical protein